MKNLKRILILTLCIMMFLLCGCSNETDDADLSESETTEEIAEARTAIIFKFLEGTGITVIRADETEDAYEGMRIVGGDSIVTDAQSSVYFRVDDDKNILLDKDSKMIVEELSSGKLLLELEYGEFFFNVENKLKADETMVFQIGSTSMSIRGTSGGGSSNDGQGSFAIYTGVGVLTNSENPDVEYSIMPSIIAHFDEENPGETVELAPLKEEEVSPLLAEYAESNEEYKEELTDKGWEITEEGVKTAEVTVPETAEEKSAGSYVGWRQNKDGSWTFSQEDFNNGVGPTYYKEEVVETKKIDEVVFNTLSVTEEEKQEIKENTEVAKEEYASSQTVVISDGDEEEEKNDEREDSETGRKTNPTQKNNIGSLDVGTNSDGDGDAGNLTSITAPTLDTRTTITYDAKSHAAPITGYDSTTMNVEGDMSGTEGGNYKVIFTPKEGYEFSNGNESVTLTWEIKKISVKVYLTIDKDYDGNTAYAMFDPTNSDADKYGLTANNCLVGVSYDGSFISGDSIKVEFYGNDSDINALSTPYTLNYRILENPGYEITFPGSMTYYIHRKDVTLTPAADIQRDSNFTITNVNLYVVDGGGLCENDLNDVQLVLRNGNNVVNTISLDESGSYTITPEFRTASVAANYNVSAVSFTITVAVSERSGTTVKMNGTTVDAALVNELNEYFNPESSASSSVIDLSPIDLDYPTDLDLDNEFISLYN